MARHVSHVLAPLYPILSTLNIPSTACHTLLHRQLPAHNQTQRTRCPNHQRQIQTCMPRALVCLRSPALGITPLRLRQRWTAECISPCVSAWFRLRLWFITTRHRNVLAFAVITGLFAFRFHAYAPCELRQPVIVALSVYRIDRG